MGLSSPWNDLNVREHARELADHKRAGRADDVVGIEVDGAAHVREHLVSPEAVARLPGRLVCEPARDIREDLYLGVGVARNLTTLLAGARCAPRRDHQRLEELRPTLLRFLDGHGTAFQSGRHT